MECFRSDSWCLHTKAGPVLLFFLWVWIVLSWGISKNGVGVRFPPEQLRAHTHIIRLAVVLKQLSEVGTFALICVYANLIHPPCSEFSTLMTLKILSKSKMSQHAGVFWGSFLRTVLLLKGCSFGLFTLMIAIRSIFDLIHMFKKYIYKSDLQFSRTLCKHSRVCSMGLRFFNCF